MSAAPPDTCATEIEETLRDGPTIAVLDYGMGNLRSVCKALKALGEAARLVGIKGTVLLRRRL